MKKDLLIEIGVEELPAIPFLRELPNIEAKWRAVLAEYKLESEFKFYYTPRRLVFFMKILPSINQIAWLNLSARKAGRDKGRRFYPSCA